MGINITKEEVYDINKLVTPLIKEKHQRDGYSRRCERRKGISNVVI